ncbi:MAG: S8 family serine peptidase [Candidatus Yanofskybacteria bacterium]|nr:S8 family serine peptidase [Candidatus Yanofskybacteria bacterium]
MKLKWLVFVALVVFAVQFGETRALRVESEFVPGELIVKFKSEYTPTQHFLNSYDLRTPTPLLKKVKSAGLERGLDRLFLVHADTNNIEALIQRIQRDPRVEYAEPNFILTTQVMPNDPSFSQLWGMNNTGQTGGISDSDIDAPEAWDSTRDSNLIVGIIDTGIDYSHVDLAANIWINSGEIAGNGIDDDGNGYIDDIYGWDFVNNDNDPYDDNGHGTHVAGTIGARGNNGIGVAGVNWQVKLAALKFLNASGSGTTVNAVQAIQYANQMGFKVTNNSWGGGAYSQVLYDAISAANGAGNIFVAAAGNNGQNTDSSPAYPASYNLPNIISVAVTDSSDNKASFSNYGAASVDLGAPGVDIYSTVPISGCVNCDPTGYKSLSGTSMAAPHVSGFAALLWSHISSASHLQVKDKILSSADLIESMEGITSSGGRLNIYNVFDNDVTPPAAIVDLSASSPTNNSIILSFTAAGDDGTLGQANRYDVRYSTVPITEDNFGAAVQARKEPRPSSAGSPERFKISGLSSETTYYLAVKIEDNVRNISPLSNVVSATTLPIVTVWSDNMENGTNGWTNEGNTYPLLWHQGYRRAYSSFTAWYYGREDTGNYDVGYSNWGKLTSPVIDLGGVANAEFDFRHYLVTENHPGFDLARVQIINSDGTNLTTLFTKTTTNGSWVKEWTDISAYDGKQVRLIFYFDTIDNLYNNFEGWYVDDVHILGAVSNQQPVANAGPDQSGQTEQIITFDGSGSYDPDGSIVSYIWAFGDGTSESGVTVNHVYVNPGTYTATLTVTDDDDVINQDTAIITINSTSPVTVFADSFEVNEWNGLWTEDAQNDWSRSNEYKLSGNYSARVRGSASDSMLTSIAIDLQGRTRADIAFSWLNKESVDTGEYVAFDVSTDNGASWTEKARLRGNADPENSWQNASVTLMDVSNLKIRFRGRLSHPNESSFVDVVTVTAQ